MLLFLTIGCDQFSKYIARRIFHSSAETSFFNGFVKFSVVQNHGGFLGIVSDLPDGYRIFFLNICVSLILIACLVYLFRLSPKGPRAVIPLTLITGGGLSNLLDRLICDGGVTDFMRIGTGVLQTGIFNFADVFILFGSFFLGFRLFRH
jgi:signal peptidase II